MESLHCAGTLIVIVIVIVSFRFFYSLYQTAAYAMGKHVPSGNLFPTVRTRRPTEQREYLSTERVCSTYRSIDRPTVRYDACTVLLPKWSFLMDTKLICCEERNRLILRLSCALAVKNDTD